ncbi:MAG TPA: methyltransferase domain-containing protein [Stellaceae bacterium]|nr:methyltransferase domain-containing protein [Stellaceae bacterium]
MAEQQFRFEDGAAYEQMMGVWSRLAGDIFLDWIAPRPRLKWIDIGCGNGAFTELIVDRCAPAEVQGVDPSEAQLAFARKRPAARLAQFHQGEAQKLTFADRSFDVATMALVIFFVPDPVKGVAEMVRVLRPGGIAAAYAWDIEGGGFPYDAVLAEFRSMGKTPPLPPSVGAARMENLRKLWTDAGFREIETREISVRRNVADFEEFWAAVLDSPSSGAMIKAMPDAERERLKAGARARLPVDSAGRRIYAGRANAIKGRLPG